MTLAYPPWFNFALGALDRLVAEVPGPEGNHPEIVAWLQAIGFPKATDEIPWCGAFVARCLREDRVMLPALPGLARSYLAWGIPLSPKLPAFGCVAVFKQQPGDPGVEALTARGHTGFLVDMDDDWITLLSGNSGNRVRLSRYRRGLLLGLRWPDRRDA